MGGLLKDTGLLCLSAQPSLARLSSCLSTQSHKRAAVPLTLHVHPRQHKEHRAKGRRPLPVNVPPFTLTLLLPFANFYSNFIDPNGITCPPGPSPGQQEYYSAGFSLVVICLLGLGPGVPLPEIGEATGTNCMCVGGKKRERQRKCSTFNECGDCSRAPREATR